MRGRRECGAAAAAGAGGCRQRCCRLWCALSAGAVPPIPPRPSTHAEELKACQGQGLVAAMQEVPAPFFQETFDLDQADLWETLVQVGRRWLLGQQSEQLHQLRLHDGRCGASLHTSPPPRPTSPQRCRAAAAGAQRGGAAGEPGAAEWVPGHSGDAPGARDRGTHRCGGGAGRRGGPPAAQHGVAGLASCTLGADLVTCRRLPVCPPA